MSSHMKMVLLGRNGSGKTAVIESLLGTSITHRTSSFLSNSVHTLTKQNSHLSIIETPGLFAEGQDIYASKMRLAESVYTFTPGPDAFGLVIRIGRFTPEERTMIDILRETFGEDVFPFTILIFTRLDDLKYDDVTLEEYLQESTPELKRILNACGGRYIGFDNTGTWKSRAECGDKLLSMLQDLRRRNCNIVYSVAMLEDATRRQQKKEEEARNEQEQSYKEMKEDLKNTMRQETVGEIRREMVAEQSITAPGFAPNTPLKMVLLGRNGSGKTAVIESLLGTSITHRTSSSLSNSVHTLTKQNSHLSIIETPGLFAEGQDIYASKMRLAESVYTFTPGPDAFGLVIRIGRFTPEERTMIDILRETFGEDVFPFTILIFTRLDDLKYDDVTLEEYLQESTPELKRILNACGGRYIGFDNTGTWKSRAECGDKLLSMLQDLRRRNCNIVYSVAMLEDATRRQQKKEEEARNEQEQSYKEMKEDLKNTMRQETVGEIRREMVAEQSITAPGFAPNTPLKMVLLGRNGSGKTAVIESLLGTSITHRTSSSLSNSVHTLTKQNSHLSIIETPGLFAEGQDIYASKMRLAESVYTFTPGPDAFGLVIRIGRFTPEERTMIDILRETFGEDVFPFTILIFTRLDDLKYDDVTLEEYLQESTPELKRILNACGGRYIGFDNTGTWKSRAECGDKLLSMLQDLRRRNCNIVYSVAMLEDATRRQQKKEEEARNEQEQSYREMKEELKSTMRQEMEDEKRREMLAGQRITVPSLVQDVTIGSEPSKPQTKIYTRQKPVSGDTVSEAKSRKGAAPQKHDRGPKPILKPKPTPPKVQENISVETQVQDGAQNEAHATRVKPKRKGIIGRLIRFWESFHQT